MDNRIILPLLCAASAVAFVAAPSSHNEKPIAVKHYATEMAAPIVTTFDITRPKEDADKLKFTLNVKNNTTKMLELRFPDGQTHDFVVKDFAGKEVWRWSQGRMFTSAMRSETLKGKGEKDESRRELQTAIKLAEKSPFADVEEAKKALATL